MFGLFILGVIVTWHICGLLAANEYIGWASAEKKEVDIDALLGTYFMGPVSLVYIQVNRKGA